MFNPGIPWKPEDLPRHSGEPAGVEPDGQGLTEGVRGDWFLPLATQVGDAFVPSPWPAESMGNVRPIQGADGVDWVSKAEDRLVTLERDAYKRGFMRGCTEAYAQERERIEAALDWLTRVTRELSRMKRNVLEEAEKEILELALAIGRKAVLGEISVNREVVVNAVRAAVKEVAHEGDLRIRVNPKDLAIVEEHRPELLGLKDGEGEVAFLEDASIDPGGCIVETEHQIVEYHPHQQIEAIGELLRKRSLEEKEGTP